MPWQEKSKVRLLQFPESNTGKGACCRMAASMMGKDEVFP